MCVCAFSSTHVWLMWLCVKCKKACASLRCCLGKDYHHASFSPIESNLFICVCTHRHAYTRTHTQPHAHCLYLSPPHFMSKNRSFSQWSLCFSKQAGMCMGLTTAHALKSFLFLTHPHLHPYTHAHALSEQSIQGADGSQCIWDKRPCALRQLTGNRAHWHAGSTSLPVQESKPHPIESWEVVSSQSMTAMSSLHPYILSPPSGEVNLRLTINTTQSNVTELVVVEQVCGLRMDC